MDGGYPHGTVQVAPVSHLAAHVLNLSLARGVNSSSASLRLYLRVVRAWRKIYFNGSLTKPIHQQYEVGQGVAHLIMLFMCFWMI